jgi:hypothetical protein
VAAGERAAANPLGRRITARMRYGPDLRVSRLPTQENCHHPRLRARPFMRATPRKDVAAPGVLPVEGQAEENRNTTV